MPPERILRSRHIVPLIAAGGLLIVMIVVAVSTFFSVRRATNWVNQTYHVIAQVNTVVTMVKETESEQRGFLLTGNAAFLTAYESQAADTLETLKFFKTLLRDNPRQLARVARLTELIAARFERLRQGVAGRAGGGMAGVLELMESEATPRIAYEIRTVAHEMLAEESTLLEQRQRRLDREVRQAAGTIIVAGALAFLMAGYSYHLMRRALSALSREADLLRLKEKAERSDREKSEFLANMSHEIRTPMNAVLGFTELLRGTVTAPQQRQYVESIHASGKALLALINDILDLSKIEAGKLDVMLRPVSVRSVLEVIRTIFLQQASERGLALAVTVDDGVPPAVMFDPSRLRQILFNVVGNALKFTPRGSVSISATARPLPDDDGLVELEIAVADTGIGIAPEHHETIFEPFRQVVDATAAQADGTGLGLSITRRLTHMLGGRVHLTSSLGQGSTFTFTFPKVVLAAMLPEDGADEAITVDLSRLRPALILVVDDVALNRDLLAGFFAKTHHEVILVDGGRKAVEVARTRRPDVVLMDIRMPDIDGREAHRLIREDPALAKTVIIAVTASSLLTEEQDLRRVFEGYIRKPFSRVRLYQELARFLSLEGGKTAVPELATDAFKALDPTAWRRVLTHLQAQEREVWPTLSRSMGLRETEQFARALLVWGEEAGCPPVRDYARRLLTQVQAFEIAAQEETIRDFPRLVAEVADAMGKAGA